MFLNPSTHDSSYGPYYEFDALKLGNKPKYSSKKDDIMFCE